MVGRLRKFRKVPLGPTALLPCQRAAGFAATVRPVPFGRFARLRPARRNCVVVAGARPTRRAGSRSHRRASVNEIIQARPLGKILCNKRNHRGGGRSLCSSRATPAPPPFLCRCCSIALRRSREDRAARTSFSIHLSFSCVTVATSKLYNTRHMEKQDEIGSSGIMDDSFVVIDFETANPKRVSACSVGGCVIKQGEIVDSFSSFIRPPQDYGGFAPMNVRIHGITPDKVADAPTFEDLFPRFKARVDGNIVVSYSKFDLSVINSLLEYYGHTSRFRHIDVCALAKDCISGLPNYKLPTVAKHLGLGKFTHHDAAEDALMCAKVFLALKHQAVDSDKPCQSRPHVEPFAEAFNGFATAIVEDGVVDYKEAVELMCFLEILPKVDVVVRLHQTVVDFLSDGVITEDESNILIELLNIASHQFAGRSYALCRACGGPLLAEVKGACPWCLARESQDCELHDDAASHLDEIAESLSDGQKIQKQEG